MILFIRTEQQTKERRSKMKKSEAIKRIAKLEEVQGLLNDAIFLIRTAMEGTKMENTCESYIIQHLDNWGEGINEHDDTTIPRLIEYLENEMEADEE